VQLNDVYVIQSDTPEIILKKNRLSAHVLSTSESPIYILILFVVVTKDNHNKR